MVRPVDPSVLAALRSPGFAPRLKPSLKFYKSPNSSVVTVTELPSGRQLQLYDFECQIAQEMDGHRNLDELTKRARRYAPGVNRDTLEKFVLQCASMGLLSNLMVNRPAQPAPAPAPAGPGTPLKIGTGVDFSKFRDQLFDEVNTKPAVAPVISGIDLTGGEDRGTDVSVSPFADDPFRTNSDLAATAARVVSTTMQGMPAAPTVPQMNAVTMPGMPVVTDMELEPEPPPEPAPSLKKTTAIFSSPSPLRIAPAPRPEAAVHPIRPLPAPEPPRIEPVAVVTPPVVAPAPAPPVVSPQPQPAPPVSAPAPEPAPEPDGDEWRAVLPPWYTRPWFRRLRFFLVLGVLVGGLALFPWPLYVTEECTVLPMGRVDVRAQVDGIIGQILVDEGARVKPGQLLARLDDRDAQAALRQARADVDRLSANLLKMKRGSRKEEIATAKANLSTREHDLKFAKLEADRREQLFSQGVGSGEQRDQALRDLELKRTAVEQARAELKLLKAGFRSEEVAVAEAELKRAEGDVQYQEKKLALLDIASPIEGVVMTPKFRERLNERVSAGATLCEVADNSKVRVEIFVPEREFDVVRLGQPTVVKVQSYPLHPFKGKVTFIGSVVEEKEGARFLRVGTEIDNTEGLLREHMTGYAEINTGPSHVLNLLLRRLARWIRVRFLV